MNGSVFRLPHHADDLLLACTLWPPLWLRKDVSQVLFIAALHLGSNGRLYFSQIVNLLKILGDLHGVCGDLYGCPIHQFKVVLDQSSSEVLAKAMKVSIIVPLELLPSIRLSIAFTRLYVYVAYELDVSIDR